MKNEMDRRGFLRYSAALGISLTLGTSSSVLGSSGESGGGGSLAGILVADAHAHPDQLYAERARTIDRTSTLASIVDSRMALSAFAAVGDTMNYMGRGQTEFLTPSDQIARVRRLAEKGKVKLVLHPSDLPNSADATSPPCALLALEGGDPLKGASSHLKDLFDLGVRMITLVHNNDNELAAAVSQSETGSAPAGGLTPAGRKMVEAMQTLGMVVDVAHAQPFTLKQVAEMSTKPIVDSHTSLCARGPRCGRLRAWEEMELVARTGGVVCTWPLSYDRNGTTRTTFAHWAQEILEMKQRLGMEHVGLGTDGGGGLPSLIKGYRDVRDLHQLASAMMEVGLSREDIAAYMGGNFLRVLRDCLV